MFIPFVAILLLVSVPLTGGRLTGLAEVRLRSASLALLALVLQVVITTIIPTGPRPLLVALHLVTYGLAGVVLWRNRRLPGLVLIGVGALLNGTVIALNRGTLPASADALARAGQIHDPSDFANSGVLAHPILAPLGDVVATPAWLPFRNVISVGDVLILLGTAVLLHVVCGTWLSPARWRRRGRPAASSPQVPAQLDATEAPDAADAAPADEGAPAA